jgi:predicted membrane protein
MTPEKMARVQTYAVVAVALKSLFADFLLIAGLCLICYGVGKYSVAAGFIATGAMLIISAISFAPKKDAKKATN